MAQDKLISTTEVSNHNTPDDCWIVVDNQVWDVTNFLDEHPGGSASESEPSEVYTVANLD